MTDILKEQDILDREGYLYRSLREAKHQAAGKNSDPLPDPPGLVKKAYPKEEAAREDQKAAWDAIAEREWEIVKRQNLWRRWRGY